MAGLSKYLALALFDMSLNPARTAFTPPAGLWLALHTAAPGDATYGNEATYGAYARQTLNSMYSESSTETAGGDVNLIALNGAAIVFPASTGPAGQTITHWAIWDSATRNEGNILYSGALASSRFITVGDSVVIPEGNLLITIV